MRDISHISNFKIKEKALLVGKGESIDFVDWDALETSGAYDICTISDAIRLVRKPKYSFCCNLSFIRFMDYIKNAESFIMPLHVVGRMLEDYFDYLKYLSGKGIYYFIPAMGITSDNITDYKKQSYELFDGFGSVVGAVQFLVENMGYKHIEYVGFDGGLYYGKKLMQLRKETKIEKAAKSYEMSWGIVNKYIEKKPIKFTKLEAFNG